MKKELFIQYQGNEINEEQLVKDFKEIWKSKNRKIKDIDKLQLYYNVDEEKCYYVVNDKDAGAL